ncbi:hypothetical protein Golob_026028, partial [Gossypium lobatum]|nr:hypothetical protein [Gossypium lobatum]
NSLLKNSKLPLCSFLTFIECLLFFVILDSLRYTSALSVGFAIVFVAITAGVTIVKLMEGKIEMHRLMPKLENQASFWKLFTTVPVLITAYVCHHNVLPIANELRDPTQMKLIVRKSLMFCFSLYIATSFFRVVLFGNHILDDVLANFDGDLGIPYSSWSSIPYAIPIAFSEKRFFSMTVALMGFIFMGANFIPSIWDAFQFTDATAAVCVGYIFPATITLSVPGAVRCWKPELMGKETIWVPFMRFTLKANLTNRGSVLYELAGNEVFSSMS